MVRQATFLTWINAFPVLALLVAVAVPSAADELPPRVVTLEAHAGIAAPTGSLGLALPVQVAPWLAVVPFVGHDWFDTATYGAALRYSRAGRIPPWSFSAGIGGYHGPVALLPIEGPEDIPHYWWGFADLAAEYFSGPGFVLRLAAGLSVPVGHASCTRTYSGLAGSCAFDDPQHFFVDVAVGWSRWTGLSRPR